MNVSRFAKAAGTAVIMLTSMTVLMETAIAQSYTAAPELQSRIDSHPHVRQLTTWGGRPDWSPDNKHLLFISKEYGDIFELDVASGETRPLSFHYSHDGIFRAYYLANGDYLLTAPREHTPGLDSYGRLFDSELWVLKADLSGPPIPLGEGNIEGVAVARSGMRIAWGAPHIAAPPRPTNSHVQMTDFTKLDKPAIWTADIVYNDSTPELVRKRKLLDCNAPNGTLAALLVKKGESCRIIETQNFVPADENHLTFTMVTESPRDPKSMSVSSYSIDISTGKIVELLTKDPGYAEIEGVFPSGKWSLVEYSPETELIKATHILDLWRVALDGSGKLEPVTRYNSIDPQLKSNQGVISPDGRWMAFGVSTGEIEKKVPGQGIGIFLMDLKAAGFDD